MNFFLYYILFSFFNVLSVFCLQLYIYFMVSLFSKQRVSADDF